MVCVNFGAHVPVIDQFGNPEFSGIGLLTRFSNLGLCVDAIDIRINFLHQDVKTDGYGPAIPIDKQWMLADAHIRTRLIHYDADILELCMRETCAGGDNPTGAEAAGGLAFPGLPMGGGALPAERNTPFIPNSGYHFVSLNIIPSAITPPNTLPWRFPAAYIAEKPIIFPLGTQRSIVDIHWHAIPYGVLSEALVADLSGSIFKTFTALTIPDGIALNLTSELGFSSGQPPIWLFDHTADQAIV